MKKVFYVAPAHTSFVDLDLSILSEKYLVVEDFYNWKKKWALPFYLLAQFFAFLKNVRGMKAVFISTGGYWALVPTFLARVCGINSYIILNGSDCASLPSLNYGSLRKPIQKIACHLSYKMAAELLPVSDSLMKTENSYSLNEVESRQGIHEYFPNLRTQWSELPNGFKTDFWKDRGTQRKKASFLAAFAESQFHLKGGPLIEQLAEKYPESTFNIVGMERPNNRLEMDNLRYHGHVDRETMLNLFNEVEFYLQLSLFEGFGCALCEAMLSGCIPIVSNVNILPRIVDSVGFVVQDATLESVAEQHDNALAMSASEKDQRSKDSRSKIQVEYPSEKRKDVLFQLVDRS